MVEVAYKEPKNIDNRSVAQLKDLKNKKGVEMLQLLGLF
jgi:hypothetical protein